MALSNEPSDKLDYWKALLSQKQAILAEGAHPAYIEELHKEVESLASLIAAEEGRRIRAANEKK